MSYRESDHGFDAGSENGGWRGLGRCRPENGLDPDIWSPRNEAGEERALYYCNGCPVRRECTAWAVETKQTEGVWGVTNKQLRAQVTARWGATHRVYNHPGARCAHPRTPDNTYVRRDGKTSCRDCKNEKAREARAAKHVAVPV